MDVVSQISPAGSVSPPISPIKFVQPSSSLPPIRSLPTWNRTSLGRSKVLTSIVKDAKTPPTHYSTEFESKLFLQNSSKCTQTSPLTRTTNIIDSNTFHASHNGRSRLTAGSPINNKPNGEPSGIEKKLIFIHSRHEDILSRLHCEVDRLKNENKELNFKLVMNNGSFRISPGKQDKVSSAGKLLEKSSASKHSSATAARKKADKLEEVKVIFLKEEVNDLKNALRDEKHRNAHLSQTVNSQKQRTKSGSTSAKKSENFGHLPGNKFPYRNPPLPPVETSCQQLRKVYSPALGEANNFDKSSPSSSGKASAEYQKMIRNLQQMNAKQAHELNKFRNKYENQKRQTIEDAHRRTEDKLPRLQQGNASKSARITGPKYGKHDGIVLPALRTTHGHKLADRQKKAQAMHVQRQQRTNREFSQKLL